MRALDDFLSEYEFSERHSVDVQAPPERVDRALREVTLADVPVVRALLALRGLERPSGPIVQTLGERPVVLEDVPGEGIVLGVAGQFWRLRGGTGAPPRSAAEFLAFDRPDSCKAVVDFRAGPGVLTTETRVHATDEQARRKFARYWYLIRPFSGLIRIAVLRAARRKAEG